MEPELLTILRVGCPAFDLTFRMDEKDLVDLVVWMDEFAVLTDDDVAEKATWHEGCMGGTLVGLF